MKAIISLFMAMLLVLSIMPIALAEGEIVIEVQQDDEVVVVFDNDIEDNEVIVEEIDIEIPNNETPAITPDQPLLWGLKRAVERIDLALTFNKAAKAKKGLMHARERLLEVEAMIAEKKLDSAEKAQKARERIMEKVQENIEELEKDPEEEIGNILELANGIEGQENRLSLLKIKMQFKQNLTIEQRTRIDRLIEGCSNGTNALKLKIEEKKERTKIRIKAMTEKTDEEIEELIAEKEETLNITATRAQRVLSLTKVIEQLEGKRATVRGINVSGVIGKLEQVRERLEIKSQEQIQRLKRIREQVRNETDEEEIECETDEDCDEDEVCVNNECEDAEVEDEEESEDEDEEEDESDEDNETEGTQTQVGQSE